MRKYLLFLIGLCIFNPIPALAAPSNTELAVWANEAIIATYTFDYQNFITEQKTIAKYFTAEGWIKYNAALFESKLPDQVKKNSYFVSAVAQLPIQLKTIDSNHWEASAPIMVVYKNPAYQQKQTLQVTIQFSTVEPGQGVRGLAMTQLIAIPTEKPCECK